MKKACEKCKLFDIEKTNRDLLEQLDKLEQEVKHWQMECREAKAKGEWTYDLVRKKVDRLEQENKQMKSVLEEINRVVKLAHKVKDYLLGQDYTDLVDRIEKEINEVNK